MDNAPIASVGSGWKQSQVFMLCGVCLVVGVLVGYLVRGSESQSSATKVANSQGIASQPTSLSMPPSQQMPSLEDMRRMADKQAEPLLSQLKADPKNMKLLNEIGLVYKTAHQFEEAAKYFDESLQVDPTNIAVRADYASCLFYSGDVDGALTQLNKSLEYDPKHAGTLINIGIIKWKGKNDPDGAVQAWEKVLKYHPDFPQKAAVEHMIAEAKQSKKTSPVAQKG